MAENLGAHRKDYRDYWGRGLNMVARELHCSILGGLEDVCVLLRCAEVFTSSRQIFCIVDQNLKRIFCACLCGVLQFNAESRAAFSVTLALACTYTRSECEQSRIQGVHLCASCVTSSGSASSTLIPLCAKPTLKTTGKNSQCTVAHMTPTVTTYLALPHFF